MSSSQGPWTQVLLIISFPSSHNNKLVFNLNYSKVFEIRETTHLLWRRAFCGWTLTELWRHTLDNCQLCHLNTYTCAVYKYERIVRLRPARCVTGVFSATCAAYEEIVRVSCCPVSGQNSVHGQNTGTSSQGFWWFESWWRQLSTFSPSPCNTKSVFISSWVWSHWSEETMNIQLIWLHLYLWHSAPTPVWLKRSLWTMN